MNINSKESACFTGHRPHKLTIDPKDAYNERNPVAVFVKRNLKEAIETLVKKGVNTFISGMALGVDTWAAEIVLSLKTKYPHIKLVAAVPFGGQEKKWPRSSQERFSSILQQADMVQIVSGGEYSPIKMQIRNEWMVNHSHYVIAVWDGTKGGTGNCVRYAQQAPHQPSILYINPEQAKQKAKERA